jgi:hypothetical protein
LEVSHAEARVVDSNQMGVVVALGWQTKWSAELNHRYQALKLRDGLVHDIQDYRNERAARRVLGLRS